LIEGKVRAVDEIGQMREAHSMKASLMDLTFNAHGIMQFMILEIVKLQMQQYWQ
jgi:hypothetical protein